MTRITDLVADVRALGWGAPVRAGYELSKHAGGHRLLFGHLASRPREATPPLDSPYRPPPAAEIPAEARERVLRRAAEVVAGEVELFARPVEVGPAPDWHACIDGDRRWAEGQPWWRIPIRGAARVGDVKWTWELGRHRHLVTLARAVHLEPGNPAWLSTLESQLASFLAANPPETGIHWYSNLELALRAVAWVQIDALAGDRLHANVRDTMVDHLYRYGSHLVAELPYTVSSMANNHLLGDALGLLVLSASFPGDARARRWGRIGARLFDRQAARTFRPDGSTNEDSLSYTRFVLEMVTVRLAFATDAAGRTADAALAAQTARYLVRLGALAGPVPRFGDGDEGRALAAYGGPDDLAGSVLAALALAGEGASEDQRRAHDECAWYCRDGIPAPVGADEREGHDVGGGTARAIRAETTVWLKGGTGDWHGHADPSSVWIQRDGRWIVADPGTGNYNGAEVQRAWFRSSVAHDALRVEDAELLEAHRTFRWITPHLAVTHDPVTVAGGLVLWCTHTCFERLEPARRVARTVLVADDGTVVVTDWCSGPAPVRWALSLPIPPDVTTEIADDAIELVDASGERIPLSPPTDARVAVVAGDADGGAWWSPSYGAAEEAARVAMEGTASAGFVAWALGPRAASLDTTTDRMGVTLGPLTVHLTWSPTDDATLRVTSPGGAVVRSVKAV